MKKKILLTVMALSLTMAAPCAVYAQDTNTAPATSEGLEAEDAIEIPEYETADYAEDFIYSKKDEGLDKLKKNPCDEQGKEYGASIGEENIGSEADLFSYVGSYSGIKSNFDLFKSTMDEKYSDYDIKYWFNGEGVEDIAVAEHMAFYNDVKEQMSDKFVDGENLAMVMLEDGNHAWTSWITDLYNSLLVFFKK